MKFKNFEKMYLQMFAGDGDGASGDGGGAGTGGSGEGGNQIVSFDDYLKLEGNQAEFDRRVQKAINTAVANAQEKWKALSDEKLSEAEKLAKMTKDEKEEYMRQKERNEFEKEKAAFEREKLLVEVKKELQSQSLPLEFSEALADIADAEKIKTAIAEIKKVWDAAITEAIKSKARQETPIEGGRSVGTTGKMSDLREMAKKNRIIKN